MARGDEIDQILLLSSFPDRWKQKKKKSAQVNPSETPEDW